MKLPFLLLLMTFGVLCTSRPVCAQTVAFTPEDLVFFQQKSVAYQRWLDQTGLGESIRVTKVRLKKEDTEVELLLRANSPNLDTAIALWNRAKEDYLLAAGRPLEEGLFQTFAAFMEIPPAQGNVQVYVLDTASTYIPCFYVGIWEDQGEIRTDVRLGECKSQELTIPLKPRPLRKTVKGQTTEISRTLTREQVFDGIESFIKNNYLKKNCYDRYPELQIEKREGNVLKISVTDLCKVVLTDEKKSAWCKMMEALGGNCNDMRRERLEFTFRYPAGSNELTGEITGKFGSGVYRPRKSGYMDMEPDFNDYLEDFHKKFKEKLETHLNKL